MSAALRHPPEKPPTAEFLPLRRHAVSTLISGGGTHGDRSFLLIQERRCAVPTSQRVILHGDFGPALRARLERIVAALPVNDKSLIFDLRQVTLLDESCLAVLVTAQKRRLAAHKVIFLVAAKGQVRDMIQLLKLESLLGREELADREPQGIAPLRSVLPLPCLIPVPKGAPLHV